MSSGALKPPFINESPLHQKPVPHNLGGCPLPIPTAYAVVTCDECGRIWKVRGGRWEPYSVIIDTDDLEIMRDHARAVVPTIEGIRNHLLRDIVRIAEKYLPADRTPGLRLELLIAQLHV